MPTEEIVQRVAGRLICRNCHATYHEIFAPLMAAHRVVISRERLPHDDDQRLLFERGLSLWLASPEFAGSYGSVIHEMTEARDVRMGQYGHSNQVAHHVTYMYDAAGQPSKAQEKIREVLPATPAGALFWIAWIVLGVGAGLGVHYWLSLRG